MPCKYGVPEYPVVRWRHKLLVSPSVSSLQCILRICEAEFEWLDMRINPNKSWCVRFGARYSIKCRNILTSDNCKLAWSESVRYLGVYLRSARSFACSYSYAKKGNVSSIQCSFRKSWESCIPRCSNPACQNQVPTHTVLCCWSVSN